MHNVKVVDLTPTWQGLLPALLFLLSEGETESARNTARNELAKMAKMADLYVNSLKEKNNV